MKIINKVFTLTIMIFITLMILGCERKEEVSYELAYEIHGEEAYIIGFKYTEIKVNYDKDFILKIPDTYQGYPVTRITDGAFLENHLNDWNRYPRIVKIIIPESIIYIGNRAFAGCKDLIEIMLEKDDFNNEK